MAYKIPLLLFFISCRVLGQNVLNLSIEDYNNDGFKDSLYSYYEGGSAFGGMYANLRNGKTGEKFEMTNASSFGNIKNIIIIPPALNKPENKAFREAITDKILPVFRTHADPSLKWILASSIAIFRPENNPYFDLILNPDLSWESGPFVWPDFYSLLLSADSLKALMPVVEEIGNKKDDKQKGILIYYGHNHYREPGADSLILVASSKMFQIFRTSHGILVKKGMQYKWLFISDNDISGAPEKLRWKSIGKIALYDHYIIFQQKLPPFSSDRVFVINISNGVVGRLVFDFINYNYDENFDSDRLTIKNDSIVTDTEEGAVSVALSDIFNALDNEIQKFK